MTRLTSELIADTTLWDLRLKAGQRRLDALLTGPMSAERPVLSLSVELPDGTLKALENAIYDNPLLLSDFHSVNVVLDAPDLCQVPAGTEAMHQAMANAMLPDTDAPRTLLADPMPDDGTLLHFCPTATLNFMQRTFPDAHFHHSLSIGARWLAYFNHMRGDSAHTYALCGADELQVYVFSADGALAFANRFDSSDSVANCAYFILAATPEAATPMSVGGLPTVRNEVMALLRRARPHATVLPLTLPDSLLDLRRQVPETLSDDLLFSTQL